MSFSSAVNLLILSLAAGLATLIGVYIGTLRDFGKRGLVFGTSFAAGIMILISVFELLPSVVKNLSLMNSSLFLLLGIMVVWLVNLIVPHIHSIKDIEDSKRRHLLKISYLLTFGMILHDFPEGFAIASSTAYSASLGLMIILGLFIHNIPEGYVLSLASLGLKARGYRYQATILSTLATVLGTALGIVLLQKHLALSSVFNALAAGAMIFISAHELIPLAIKHKDKIALTAGFVFSLLIYFILNLFI